MLLHNDIVANGEAKAGALSGRLGGEERIEHFLLHFQGDAGAIIADPDLDLVAEALLTKPIDFVALREEIEVRIERAA